MLGRVKADLMRYNLIEAILGALVLLVAAYFLIFAYSSGSRHVGAAYPIVAKFDRIDGLAAGGDVKVSGVKVGLVEKFEVDKNTYQARVTLMISKDVKLPDDSSAEIVSESLLGGKYISLVPGISESTIPSGGMITRTQSSVNFESLISKFLFAKDGDKSKAKK
jgi:phospholipid/cholesterol/gamma-HCH transport system substrate-binding protein